MAALVFAAVLGVGAVQQAAPEDRPAYEPITAALGGEGSRPIATRMAFSFSMTNLDAGQVRPFFLGNRIFNTNWTQAPASVEAFDGLGPVFNRVSCSGCHLRDGPGRPPLEGEDEMLSMLIRLSRPDESLHPVFGAQLQDRSVHGVAPEGRAEIRWTEEAGRYPDGTPYSLRRPEIRFSGRIAEDGEADRLQTSPRVAQGMIGLGLLEAVPEETILALADPEDADGDGISGRPNRVPDIASGRLALGRFGWKANQPSLRQQSAAAAHGDIGLTSTLFPTDNCPAGDAACREAAALHEGAELSDRFLDALELYTRVLAVPTARGLEAPEVRRGEALFHAAGCAACHVPTLETAAEAPVVALAGQRIHPFTDLLLHDMGEGLADGRPDLLASGTEWRTPPLWGLGLRETVAAPAFYLHDGRARSIEEAILWHGGEAAAARGRFVGMAEADRAALIRFLEAL